MVVIPVRNGVAFIAAAIDSVLAQTWPVSEILVVDGGSEDGTRDIVAAYGSPVRLRDQWNGHQGERPVNRIAHARNLGIQAAGGDWRAFLDADDWWDSTKLACQIAALAEMPDGVLSYRHLQSRYSNRRAPQQPRRRFSHALAGAPLEDLHRHFGCAGAA